MKDANGNRAVERVKTALIAFLILSALILGWQTKMFNEFFRSIPLFGGVAEFVRGTAGSGTPAAGGGSLIEAARPLSIVITNNDGERYGVKYDTAARNSVYERTSSIMGEALGSASEPSEISEPEWLAALAGLGVFFEYAMPVRLSVLGGWLGASVPDAMSNVSLRRMFLAISEDRSRLYYLDNDSGAFYVADTASSAGKAQELDIYSANGALFAFETGVDAPDNAAYTLILPGNTRNDIHASASGSAEELLDYVLNAMGHQNEIYTPPYYNNSGVLICVGAQFNIGVDTFGRVTYRRTDTQSLNNEIAPVSDSEAIEIARAIAADTIGAACGGAEVFFESMEYGNAGQRYIYFGYYIAGGHVSLYEVGYAARIIISEGAAIELELNFRSYSVIDEYTKLLPEKLALAAAGGEFLLSYTDSGAEKLLPTWVRSDND